MDSAQCVTMWVDLENKHTVTTSLALKTPTASQILATKASVRLAVRQEHQVFVIMSAAVLTLYV